MKVFELQQPFGLDAIKLVDRPLPQPAARQVLLKMRAASLNYRDLLIVKGLYNPRMKLPRVPLSDGVGEVVAVGDGVTRAKIGDRLCPIFAPAWLEGDITDAKAKSALAYGGDGVLAEHLLVDEESAVQPPDHLTDEEASTLPCAAVTAWNALAGLGQVKPGDVVLIQGTGGVSLFALQFAKILGARVIATSGSDQKLQRVLAMGASDGINYRAMPDWDKRALDLTGGVGVDHIVEVGGAGTLEKSLRAVRMGGTISLIGTLSGNGDVNPVRILMRQIRLQGVFVGSRSIFQAMNRAISFHQLRPVVDRVFPFNDAIAAMNFMETGSHFGKIVIRMD